MTVRNAQPMQHPVQGGAKVPTLIRAKDYPKDKYSAMWEIFIYQARDKHNEFIPNHFEWGARIYTWSVPTTLLEEEFGVAPSVNEARIASQTWVLGQMPKYKREG